MFLPYLLSLLFLLIVAYAGRTHTFGAYSTETDFYHFYAPDAERMAMGRMPENSYQGPGYPLVLALLSKFTGDVFLSGKWLSLLSAAVVGLLVFTLFERLFSFWIGVGAQLITFASTEFAEFALCATTDMFFLMLCLACFVVFISRRWHLRWRLVACAVLVSLTYLTRYNGLFLAVVFIFGITVLNIWRLSWRERLRSSLIFIAIFFAVAAPWLVANYRHHGSPFYNTNYLNIATEYYPELVDNNYFQEGTRKLTLMFQSFGDVIAYDSARLISHYPVNLWNGLQNSVSADFVSPWVGWFALLGFMIALVERRSPEVLLLLSATVCYFMLLALTHWETRYYFFVMVIYAGLAVYAASQLAALIRNYYPLWHQAARVLPVVLFALMFSTSLMVSYKQTAKFLSGQPYEVVKVCEYFERENLRASRVVARKPHVPSICGQQWIFFPTVKSLPEMQEWLRENPADFVVISRVEISRRKEFSPLKDPSNAPPWLTAVWVNEDPTLVLYRVNHSHL